MPINPLDWTAGPFLTLYLGVAALAWFLTIWLRRNAGHARPGDYPGTPTAVELAFLTNGRNRAAETVLVGFLASGAAAAGPGGGTLAVADAEGTLPAALKPFRAAVAPTTTRATFLKALRPGLQAVRDKLIRDGLVPNAAERAALTRATLLTMAIPIVLGVLKIAVAIPRGRPVGILAVLTVATLILAISYAFFPPPRTRAGTAVLTACRQRFARAARAPGGDEMALAFALSGAAVLAGTPHARVLANGSSSGGSGCSGGGGDNGGGDSGGGSGCGGCGGGSD